MGIAYGANYGRPSLDLNFARNKSLIDTISGQNLVTFSRAQANYLTTYVGSDGLIKYASADEPRFDHNPVTGESLGLLIEESRTNLFRYSEQFDNAAWGNSGRSTLTPNTIASPDGTISADSCIVTVTGFNGSVSQSVSLTSGTTYTLTFYLKYKGFQFVRVGFGIDNTNFASFDLQSGLVVYTGSNITTSSISTFADGWYRCTVRYVAPSTGTYSVQFFPVDIVNNTYTTVSGTNGVYVWGAQLESGSFPTSYIPTDGTPGGKTRSADEASITGTNFSRWYNQSEGTLFTKRSATQTTAGNFVPEWQICGASDNGPQLLDGLLFNNSSSFMSVNNFSAGSTAVAMKSNNFASSFNGGAVTTNTTEPMQTGRTFIRIGRQIGGNTTMMTTRFSRLTYYPTRLQNFQLQQLTK